MLLAVSIQFVPSQVRLNVLFAVTVALPRKMRFEPFVTVNELANFNMTDRPFELAVIDVIETPPVTVMRSAYAGSVIVAAELTDGT